MMLATDVDSDGIAVLRLDNEQRISSAGVTFDEAFAVEHDRVFDEFLLGAFGPGPVA
jgi:hypothetical protein